MSCVCFLLLRDLLPCSASPLCGEGVGGEVRGRCVVPVEYLVTRPGSGGRRRCVATGHAPRRAALRAVNHRRVFVLSAASGL